MYKKAIVLIGSVATSTQAFAASVVPAAALTTLSTDGNDTMVAVGGAMIGLAVVAVLFKWAKAAIFG